ncbi:helix-turn-helix domain-containing protein [uncultured Prevotella sp.]|uniref:AraC family transcriptional regulator n=1 Tax=uncultured Prevotella sp. TaxID=159272 RepID=UPI0027E321D5|nr:helix-turn-helix domain-containing protein [uncultured Prevotella sp.]
MSNLYLLQFACFLFMLFNALVLLITRIQVKWISPRYERSRRFVLAGIIGMAAHFFAQMCYGFRATNDAMGATINILIYTPCFSLIALGIYHIEATHMRRWRIYVVSSAIYVVIVTSFGIGYFQHDSLHIGNWLYVMLALFAINMVYFIVSIIQEMIKRRRMLEKLSGSDILPNVRYSQASVFLLFLIALIIPLAILFTPLLYIVGPLGLVSFLFFILSFVALGYSYVPTEDLLNEDEPQSSFSVCNDTCHKGQPISETTDNHNSTGIEEANYSCLHTDNRREEIQKKLDEWCTVLGYKDGNANLLSLSHSINVSKEELSLYFDHCLKTTFRLWLSDIRFRAAKKMMIEFPNYSNDIISSECGFSSRTHLYRIFKAREGCTPTDWREQNRSSNHKA